MSVTEKKVIRSLVREGLCGSEAHLRPRWVFASKEECRTGKRVKGSPLQTPLMKYSSYKSEGSFEKRRWVISHFFSRLQKVTHTSKDMKKLFCTDIIFFCKKLLRLNRIIKCEIFTKLAHNDRYFTLKILNMNIHVKFQNFFCAGFKTMWALESVVPLALANQTSKPSSASL